MTVAQEEGDPMDKLPVAKEFGALLGHAEDAAADQASGGAKDQYRQQV